MSNQAANITVQNADNADVVYTVLQPSGGNAPAIYRVEDTLKPSGLRDTAQITATSNGPKTARRLRVSGKCGYIVEGEALAWLPFEFTTTVPGIIPDDLVNNMVAQQTRLIASAAVRHAISVGFAPN